jgi:predicted nucleotidyltransferase
MINQQQIDIIKKFLIKHLDVDVIYLFGSSVKNTMRKDSDIDVAFLSDKSVDSFDLFLLTQKLADLLGREVDLIDIKKASTVFQAQIILHRRRVI